MSVAAVVLAAGASRRLGRPKQNVVIAGETLLQRAIRLSGEASLSPIIVVCRTNEDTLGPDWAVTIAINHEADEGLASSIRCGIALASNHNAAGAVILPCDQPTLRADHLRALVEDESRITGSAYAGSIGVPAYFPATSFPLLLQLHGDTGARALLIDAHAIVAEDLSLDVDTEHDLAAARALLEHDGNGARRV
jgi:molybdenum cofactor cytidylyltransferase